MQGQDISSAGRSEDEGGGVEAGGGVRTVPGMAGQEHKHTI